jgi:hypothetical protein
MNLFRILPDVFAWAAAALALFSLPAVCTSAPQWQFAIPRRIVAAVMTLSALLVGFSIFLMLVYALVGPYPYVQVLLLVPLRGQYAWTYWLYLGSLVLAQLLWDPRLRARPVASLAISLICLLCIHSARLALLIWGSR